MGKTDSTKTGHNSTSKNVERTIRPTTPKSGMEAAMNDALGVKNAPETIILPPAQEGTAVEPQTGDSVETKAPVAPATEAKPNKLGTAVQVRGLKVGDKFRYKSSNAKWECTSATADGTVIEMSKEGGKAWKVTKAKELDVYVYLIAAVATEVPAIEVTPEAPSEASTEAPAEA